MFVFLIINRYMTASLSSANNVKRVSSCQGVSLVINLMV